MPSVPAICQKLLNKREFYLKIVCELLKMKIEGCLLLLTQLTVGLRRGPHHPHGQEPVHQRHHHYQPRGDDSLTHEAELLHDTKHLEEDSKVLTAEMLANMTPEELEFHYFQAHDFDHNNKLDGLELLKAVYHTSSDEHNADADNSIEPEADRFNEYIALVDKTIQMDDKDNDGYISYIEYRMARENDPAGRTHRVLAEE